jgi:hypothetical protein
MTRPFSEAMQLAHDRIMKEESEKRRRYMDISFEAKQARIAEREKEKSRKILECSSKGDKRFSAFYAQVMVHGLLASIETHYQRVKFKNKKCHLSHTDYEPCKKGEKVDIILIPTKNKNTIELDPKYLTPWYKLLWVKYLDTNPVLVEYLKTYDDYSDMFKGKAINCQADVIRQYIKKGRHSILQEKLVKELIEIMKKGGI